MKILFAVAGVLAGLGTRAQNGLSLDCAPLDIHQQVAVAYDKISEDDPQDLPEAYSFLVGTFGGDNRIELRFPAKKTSWRWTKNNDSLAAIVYYDTKPSSYGHKIDAEVKDFSVTVTRYDNAKGGAVDGSFEGTLTASVPWTHQTVDIPVKGAFHAVRSGLEPECRKMRAVERAVYTHAEDVVRATLVKPLESMGYIVTPEGALDHAVVTSNPRPFRPMTLCVTLLYYKVKVDPQSDYGKQLQDSVHYYSAHASGDPKAALLHVSRIGAQSEFEIKVIENSPFVQSPRYGGGTYTIIHVPGTAYACQTVTPGHTDLDNPDEITRLCIGTWPSADFSAKDYVNYPFIHKTHGPWIENLDIQIFAPRQVSDAIVAKADWKGMAAVMTK